VPDTTATVIVAGTTADPSSAPADAAPSPAPGADAAPSPAPHAAANSADASRSPAPAPADASHARSPAPAPAPADASHTRSHAPTDASDVAPLDVARGTDTAGRGESAPPAIAPVPVPVPGIAGFAAAVATVGSRIESIPPGDSGADRAAAIDPPATEGER
jgi:hypothetical protein